MRNWGFLAVLSWQVAAACGEDAPPANVASWFKMNHETLEAATSDGGGRTRYIIEMAPNQDLHVTVKMTDKGKTTSSEMMLISGNLLAKGEPLQEGYEIDAIDGVSLTLQLVNQLLAAGTQKSPDDVKGDISVDRAESKRALCVATMSASGEYSAPWTIKGDIRAKAPRDIEFRLDFSSAEMGKESINFSGEWRRDEKAVAFADNMPIRDWKLYRLGPVRKTQGSSTILDYGASADSRSFATLGELRKALTEQNSQPVKKSQ